MELSTFRTWLAQVDDLTVAQRLELEEVLAGRPPRAAVAAVIEADLDAHRGCPHCGHDKVVCCGKDDGLQRFRCKECGKSFNALTGTPLARLRKKECWLNFGQSLSEGETVNVIKLSHISTFDCNDARLSVLRRLCARFIAFFSPACTGADLSWV